MKQTTYIAITCFLIGILAITIGFGTDNYLDPEILCKENNYTSSIGSVNGFAQCITTEGDIKYIQNDHERKILPIIYLFFGWFMVFISALYLLGTWLI